MRLRIGDRIRIVSETMAHYGVDAGEEGYVMEWWDDGSVRVSWDRGGASIVMPSVDRVVRAGEV